MATVEVRACLWLLDCLEEDCLERRCSDLRSKHETARGSEDMLVEQLNQSDSIGYLVLCARSDRYVHPKLADQYGQLCPGEYLHAKGQMRNGLLLPLLPEVCVACSAFLEHNDEKKNIPT